MKPERKVKLLPPLEQRVKDLEVKKTPTEGTKAALERIEAKLDLLLKRG